MYTHVEYNYTCNYTGYYVMNEGCVNEWWKRVVRACVEDANLKHG